MKENRIVKLAGTFNGEEGRKKLNKTLSEARLLSDSFTLDLSAVSELDFEALTELLLQKSQMSKAGGAMKLHRIPPRITRLAQIFKIQLID